MRTVNNLNNAEWHRIVASCSAAWSCDNVASQEKKMGGVNMRAPMTR
jgi:hypothetical protein